nr:glycosyltransferase [Thermomonas sp.]
MQARRRQRPPRILLHYPVLNTGGAERSTLRLLRGLADRGCEVHLVLSVRGGRLEPEIDPRVVVHHLRDMVGVFPARIGGIGDAGRFVIAAVKWSWGHVQEEWRSRRFANMRMDAAIAGLAGMSPRFICRAVAARKRFVFIRNDPAVDTRGRWAARIRDFHTRIDGYICVSAFVEDAMASAFPAIRKKLVTIYNLLAPEQMRQGLNAGIHPFGDAPGVIRLLSVCRLEESQKALLRMVEVHRRLLDAGLPHEWHVLGDGPDRGMLEQAIEAQGVAETFKLHGSITNPFPYYKHADICAVLSRFEGLCGVVNEARVLERPVIATRFAGVVEQIDDGVNGLIVEQDVDAICAGLASLLRDAGLRERLGAGRLSAGIAGR